VAKTSITESLKAAAGTWRIASVSLLSISSGLPLGLVLMLEPYWLSSSGVDVKTIGLVTVAQAPYAFKFLWSPLLDRFCPPWLGRRRGWVLVWQVALAALGFGLAWQSGSLSIGTVAVLTVLTAFASASQDIALDAYCVDVLDRDEQGVAVGARTALYRVGMFVSGGIAISLGPWLGWGITFAALGALYLLLAPVTVLAPEPVAQPPAPRSLREAVWDPFVGFLQKDRALEIVAFLLLYKLADNLATALVGPFLDAKGYSSVDIGVAKGTVGFVFTVAGTFVGGLFSTRLGVGRALWTFGIVQAMANLGYAAVAQASLCRPLMYAAMSLETMASGMGTGAFMVLLLRLTQKRFSATQYALFSSVFALGRTIAGPIADSLITTFN
jgi:PAT family beta-lactamase induction signal transducer AmpG